MYKPPICDCGAKLYYWEELMHEIHTPITNNGKLSKRGIIDESGLGGAYERLHCRECFQEYKMENDEQGRIIKGKKWERD